MQYITSWQVAGSIPDEVSGDFSNLPYFSGRTMARGLTHSLTGVSTRTLPGA